MVSSNVAALIPHLADGDIVSAVKAALLSTLPANPHLSDSEKSILNSALNAGGVADILMTLASSQQIPLLVNHLRTTLHGPQDQADPFEEHAAGILRMLGSCPSCGQEHSVAAYLRARHPDELPTG